MALIPSLLIMLVFHRINKHSFYGGIVGLYAFVIGMKIFHLQCGSMDGMVILIYSVPYVIVTCSLFIISTYLFSDYNKN